MQDLIDLSPYHKRIADLEPIRVFGHVQKIVGTIIEAAGPRSGIGSICHIFPTDESGRETEPVMAEIVGFDETSVKLMPLEDMRGVLPGSRIVRLRSKPLVRVGDDMLGRVLDGLGEPMDGGPRIAGSENRPLYGTPINPMKRKRIKNILDVGIRAINAFLSLGVGQKVGIFSGSGVGKSVLMGMIAKNTSADVNIIALIGERGREVREFIERDLGGALSRSVVITATSDRSPLQRLRGAFLATTIAEYYRDQGKNVLFMMDSLTRFAMARREIGLAIGEPPTSKGYTPSVFALIPALLERVGNTDSAGGITGIYTVLVEADDLNDPISDAARSVLDGHIVLSRRIAERNHYPAIDILGSTSRCMPDVISRDQKLMSGLLREVLATYADAEDLVNIGAYAKGSNPKIDYALSVIDDLNVYLRQQIEEKADYGHSINDLAKILRKHPPTGDM
jgi:flagellum-specific ATP synthase